MSTKSCSPRSRTPRRASLRCSPARSTGWTRFRSTIRTGVNANPGTQVLAGPEVRTIFLGHGPVSRRTRPFQRQGQEPVQGRPRTQGVLSGDRRGRDQQEGHARAGDAVGADDLALAVFANRRTSNALPFDPEASKKLLAEAGYPDGFEVQMDCPERPLRQRRADLPGGRRHARARSASRWT